MAMKGGLVFLVLALVASRAGAYDTWWMEQPYQDTDDEWNSKVLYNENINLT